MLENSEAITYIFHLADGKIDEIELVFDHSTFLLQVEHTQPYPEWIALDYEKCDDCPLSAEQSPACPFARALSGFLDRFERYYSYEKAVVEVITRQRRVMATRPLQEGLASLLGLIGATSGCPRLSFFRPMARFHLPFASEEETLLRAFSMFLFGEYLRAGGQGMSSVTVANIVDPYRDAAAVNRGMAARLRAAFEKDAAVNAIIILDTFAQAVPWVVGKALDELRYIFDIGPTSGHSSGSGDSNADTA